MLFKMLWWYFSGDTKYFFKPSIIHVIVDKKRFSMMIIDKKGFSQIKLDAYR